LKLTFPHLAGFTYRRMAVAFVGLLCIATMLPAAARADNPIIQHI
jgi:hypothetical protein